MIGQQNIVSPVKDNIRSFRFSGRVLEILNETAGSNLNEKFNNLVLYCYEVIPAREKQLAQIENDIKKKRTEYYDLAGKLRDVESLISTLKTVKHYGEIAARCAEQIGKGLDYKGNPKV